ncbi:SHOCT domain-containing protein [Halobacteriales archaeon Cl-PHB]
MAARRPNDGLLRVVAIVLGLLVLVPLVMMAVAMPMMGWWWGDGMAGGFSPLWGLGMMLAWLLVILGVGYLLYRGLGDRADAGTDPALEELRLAYARGDLTDEEFEERQARLRTEE